MAIIKTIKGDLIDLFKKGEFKVIAHGANCFSTMGSGIAGQIRQHFPEAYESDKLDNRGSLIKLGSLSYAVTKYGKIVNLYTQFEPGRNFEYCALKSAINELEEWLRSKSQIEGVAYPVIGIPLIGAGIGGGNWNVIKTIFEKSSLEFIVVEWDK